MAIQRKRRRRSSGSSNTNNNNPNRHYESNGPDVRIRGSAQQILEKYMQYARDAQTSGDRVKAEALFQHAEHYARIVTVFERQKEEERREREERDLRRAEERAARQSDQQDSRAASDGGPATGSDDIDGSSESGEASVEVISTITQTDQDTSAASDADGEANMTPAPEKRRRRRAPRRVEANTELENEPDAASSQLASVETTGEDS